MCKYKGVEIIEGHMMPDHVHLLLSIPQNEHTYTDLKKAKKAANQHKGYFVFDESGKAVYPIVKPKSYTVRVTVDALNIRKGAGTLYKKVGMITDRGVYTIIDIKGNWGKLKSGAG